MAETKLMSLKLLVDTNANKVLFAEASKDFVDFLIHTLSLPIGNVIKLLTTKGMVGYVGNLYTSVGSLNTDYLEPNCDVVKLSAAASGVPLLSINDEATDKKFYTCQCKYPKYVSDALAAVCPKCKYSMSSEVTYVSPKDGKNVGFVKGLVTYMVMDNLEIKPMSTISGITLINRFNVKDVGALVEKQVQVGLDEAISLLKASLGTREALTTVFLGNKQLSAWRPLLIKEGDCNSNWCRPSTYNSKKW